MANDPINKDLGMKNSKDIGQYFSGGLPSNDTSMLDWQLSPDDHTGSLVVLEDRAVQDIPAFVNHGVNIDLFGEGAAGALGGDSPDKDLVSTDFEGSSRPGPGPKNLTGFSFDTPVQNFIAGDEDVNKFISQTQDIGQRMAIREMTMMSTDRDTPVPSVHVSEVAENQSVGDVKTTVSQSDPVRDNDRSGSGSVTPNLKN